MSLDDFEIIKQLGKGSFGIVLLAKRKEDNKKYAIKRVQMSAMPLRDRENSLNEIRILASISHPNIIGYKESFFDPITKTLNLVLEFADGGDLQNLIRNHQKIKKYFTEIEIWSIFIQMVKGLKELHDHKIMHRDLKSANIFLTKTGKIKLGDLNVSKIVKMGLLYTQTGTPYYASPEVWMEKPYEYKSDIWSIGCILYEMCTLKLPFQGMNIQDVFQKVIKGYYAPIPDFYSKELHQIVFNLLQVSPKNRMGCKEILGHPIVISKMNMIFGNCETNSLTDSLEDNNEMLLETIKFINENDIQSVLPKGKKYDDAISNKNNQINNGNEKININVNSNCNRVGNSNFIVNDNFNVNKVYNNAKNHYCRPPILNNITENSNYPSNTNKNVKKEKLNEANINNKLIYNYDNNCLNHHISSNHHYRKKNYSNMNIRGNSDISLLNNDNNKINIQSNNLIQIIQTNENLNNINLNLNNNENISTRNINVNQPYQNAQNSLSINRNSSLNNNNKEIKFNKNSNINEIIRKKLLRKNHSLISLKLNNNSTSINQNINDKHLIRKPNQLNNLNGINLLSNITNKKEDAIKSIKHNNIKNNLTNIITTNNNIVHINNSSSTNNLILNRERPHSTSKYVRNKYKSPNKNIILENNNNNLSINSNCIISTQNTSVKKRSDSMNTNSYNEESSNNNNNLINDICTSNKKSVYIPIPKPKSCEKRLHKKINDSSCSIDPMKKMMINPFKVIENKNYKNSPLNLQVNYLNTNCEKKNNEPNSTSRKYSLTKGNICYNINMCEGYQNNYRDTGADRVDIQKYYENISSIKKKLYQEEGEI